MPRLRLGHGLILLVLGLTTALATHSPDSATVRLVIHYGDGVEKHFTSVPWKSGFTVLDALAWADNHPRGIELRRSGSGERTMITGIDDLSNEGGGAQSRNWVFHVNGKVATQGSGLYQLQAGDDVVWRFEIFKSGR